MAKGKNKKGGGKGKESSTQETPPTDQPSTSEVQSPGDEEEECGLTGPASRKLKRQQKKEKEQQLKQERLEAVKTLPGSISQETSKAGSEAPSEPSSSQTVSESPSAMSSRAQSEAPSEISAAPEKQEEEAVGLGLGIVGSKKKKPRPKKTAKTDTKPIVEETAPAQPVPSAPQVPIAESPAPPVSKPVLVQMPVQPGTSASVVPMSPHLAGPPPTWGRGRGAGRGWGTPAAPIPGPPGEPITAPPGLAQTQAQPQFPQAFQQRPTATPAQAQISLPPQAKPAQKPYESSVICRYRIPEKIQTKTIPAVPIRVITNYLSMNFKCLQISRYDVSFTPDRPKKMIPLVFQKVKQEFYRNEHLAFDQMKNCYSLNPLANVPRGERFHTTVDIEDQNGRIMKFEVSIKSTGVVDLGKIKKYMTERGSSLCHPTEEIQCIDVILRQGALESYVKTGRQFFKRPAKPIDLGFGFEMWTGLFQSAIFTDKAFINIDVAHKGFPKSQNMIEALSKDFQLDPTRSLTKQQGYNYENFITFIKGLKVVAVLVGTSASTGQKREYTCNGLVDPPHKQFFLMTGPDGKDKKISVGEYFEREKGYRIKYPELNCMWVGSKDKCIYFPMELLTVAYGQAMARQLNETQVSRMVKEAATPPGERLQKITEVISNMKYSQNKELKKFGLEISDKFYPVQAKILKPPTLDVGNGKAVPRKGVWQANRLLKAEALKSWGFFAVETDPRTDYNNVIKLIQSTAVGMGMDVGEPKVVIFTVRMNMLHSLFLKAQEKNIRFLFIVVSARGRDFYHKVKQMAEREVGVLTQCVKEQTARRMNQMTAKNILLKVNSKLMGINQALEPASVPRCLREGGVMVVGADVTHPSPDQSNVPSIAAVSASIDPRCYMYNIELSIQTPKKEMIVEFEDMMFDHLRVYKERNGNMLPKKIFVFRDGVSEGQFAQVMNSELQAVHNAYQRMAGAGCRPEVLFLLVQKRHHTRLFQEGANASYNVEPGTVVDTDIVHASELDFYLVSHQAIKGTARPTRYHAVCNDGRIPDDEVEQLTYYLCHLFSRCMRAVSYPTPTYYAHLACQRARSLTYGERFDNRELERKPQRLHVLDKMLQFSRMFFV